MRWLQGGYEVATRYGPKAVGVPFKTSSGSFQVPDKPEVGDKTRSAAGAWFALDPETDHSDKLRMIP